jgi:hypothetical protein
MVEAISMHSELLLLLLLLLLLPFWLFFIDCPERGAVCGPMWCLQSDSRFRNTSLQKMGSKICRDVNVTQLLQNTHVLGKIVEARLADAQVLTTSVEKLDHGCMDNDRHSYGE